MTDSTVTALATPAAVLALVTLAKRAGLPTPLAAPLAVALGVALALADHYLAGSGGYSAAASGLLLGLAASGVYDAARAVGAPGQAVWDRLSDHDQRLDSARAVASAHEGSLREDLDAIASQAAQAQETADHASARAQQALARATAQAGRG